FLPRSTRNDSLGRSSAGPPLLERTRLRETDTDTWIKTSAGWRLIATQVLALRTDPPTLRLTAPQIQEYVGRYALTESKIYEILAKNI
ncbi:MAG TPA: hypothetical protein VIX37_06545, partial [Candidatus Sulfotelmatobacter sp.]